MGANSRVVALTVLCLFVGLFHARADDTSKAPGSLRTELESVRKQVQEARAKPAVQGMGEENAAAEPIAPEITSLTNNALSPEEEKAFSGVYTAPDGNRISLGRSKEDNSWIMSMGSDAVYRLEGDRAALSVSEVQQSLPYGSGNVQVVADGQRIYGKAVRDGHTIEFYSGSGGDVEVAVDGGKASKTPATADESELRLIAKDFSETWSVTKKTTFSVTSNSFSALPGAVKSSAPQRAGGPSFSKAGDLTDAEVAALTERGRMFKKSFSDADGFEKRSQ